MNRTMTGVKLCYKMDGDRLHETEAYIVHFKKGDAIPFLPDLKEVQYTKISKWIDKKEHEYRYLHIYCGFDIETTNIYDDNNKLAFMYHWQFGINTHIIYGRTWEEFTEFLDRLQKQLKLTEHRRLIIWIANEGFEFQFMRRHLNITRRS